MRKSLGIAYQVQEFGLDVAACCGRVVALR